MTKVDAVKRWNDNRQAYLEAFNQTPEPRYSTTDSYRMNVVAIEFDEARFGTANSCLDWLAQSDAYSPVLKLRTFKLIKGYSRFLCGEKRKVFTWSELWQTTGFKTVRPQPHIIIVLDVGSQRWGDQDLPVPLPSTQARKIKADQVRQAKEVNRLKRLEEMKKKKKSASTTDPKRGSSSNSEGKKKQKVESGKKPNKKRKTRAKEEDEEETPLTPLGQADIPFSELPDSIPPSVVEKMEMDGVKSETV